MCTLHRYDARRNCMRERKSRLFANKSASYYATRESILTCAPLALASDTLHNATRTMLRYVTEVTCLSDARARREIESRRESISRLYSPPPTGGKKDGGTRYNVDCFSSPCAAYRLSFCIAVIIIIVIFF